MAKRKATPRVMPRVTEKEIDRMWALRAEGMSIPQIAKLTKRSQFTVKKYTTPVEPVAKPPSEPVTPPPAEPVTPVELVVAPYVPTLPPKDGVIARIRKWIFGV